MTLKVKIDGEFQAIEGGEISGTFAPGSSAGFPGGVETLSLDNQDVTGSIESYAFIYFSQLKALTLPPGLTGSIGLSAFRGCSSLTSLTIPDGMTGSIGGSAFYGCSSLTSLTIPDGMTGSIGSAAFYGCFSLEDLYLMSPTVMPLSNTNAFTNCPARIRVPVHLVDDYKAAPNWTVFADRIFPIED